MEKRIFIFVVSIAAVALIGLLLFLNFTRTNVVPISVPQQPANGQSSTTANELAVEASTSTISQADGFYNIKAAYPQFVGVDTSFNTEVSSFISGQVSDFKKEAKANWDARNATLATGETPLANPPDPFDFESSWNSAQVNDKYISFVENVYFFTGGAHGIQQVKSFNYDVAQNKDITMTDFLNGQQNLQKLSQLAVQKVTAQLETDNVQVDGIIQSMIQDGTQPTAGNYANFNFTKDSLTIYFQQYQVAPGYVGGVTITLSKDEMAQAGIVSGYMN